MELKDFSNMFVSEEAINEKKPEALISQLDAIVKSARECVNTIQFNRYKAQYEKEEKNALDVMISYTQTFILNENANPAMYGMRMAMYVQKLHDLRMLLKATEFDASRKTGDIK